ncbi:hypothetical protein HAX54_052759 [Datura stramonium]|uniref:Amine oxidase domain-containing protein n=1 Tax=Datura stramonium TaxID=4076 RepID=A0ABS8WSJ9_DATST|nr:hypothetical protein [Datura stramonium]
MIMSWLDKLRCSSNLSRFIAGLLIFMLYHSFQLISNFLIPIHLNFVPKIPVFLLFVFASLLFKNIQSSLPILRTSTFSFTDFMEIKDDDSGSSQLFDGILPPRLGRPHSSSPSVIVIGGGALVGVKWIDLVVMIHTDYSFGCPVDMGASWLHGVCDENPFGSIDTSISCCLTWMVIKFSKYSCSSWRLFKKTLSETEKVRNEHSHDLSVLQAISIVLTGIQSWKTFHEVLQWYICRMEAWFAADADTISLKTWDQEQVLTGGHGLMVQGYHPVIKALSKDIDIRLNHRVKSITNGYHKVMVTVEDGRNFIADAAIITVPLGVLKANLIEFEPKLPEWKQSAIADLGVGNENKIALRFDNVFWPNVELLGVVAPTSYACGYFLNLHKATGHPVLVYMAAGRLACDLEKLSDESAAEFAMLQLKKMFPDATKPVHILYLASTDPDTLDVILMTCWKTN